MARETILKSGSSGRRDEDRDLRPQRMSDMVGQREVYERLKIVVDAARKRDEPLGHVLFDGPPGLGKTTFALCIPRELGVGVQLASGPAIKAPKDMVPYLTNAEERSVLFIDEIHRLPAAVEEYLYTAMEDFRIDIVLGEGVNARTHNLWLKPFTLIGATTRAGHAVGTAPRPVSDPRAPRLLLRRGIDGDSPPQRPQAVRAPRRRTRRRKSRPAAAARRGLPTTACGGCGITPRPRRDGRVTLAVARAALKMAGIDELGLAKLDRDYLMTIIRVFGGGPVGHRSDRSHHERVHRYAGGRSRAVLAPQRTGRPHASRARGHRQGLPAPEDQAAAGRTRRTRRSDYSSERASGRLRDFPPFRQRLRMLGKGSR